MPKFPTLPALTPTLRLLRAREGLGTHCNIVHRGDRGSCFFTEGRVEQNDLSFSVLVVCGEI